MDLERRILDLEEQFWYGDGNVYRQHLAVDALMVFGPVGVLDREGIIASIQGGQRWEDVAFSDIRFVSLTNDACVVAYRADGRRAGDAPYAALVSSVYVQRHGEWKLAFHQHTPPG